MHLRCRGCGRPSRRTVRRKPPSAVADHSLTPLKPASQARPNAAPAAACSAAAFLSLPPERTRASRMTASVFRPTLCPTQIPGAPDNAAAPAIRSATTTAPTTPGHARFAHTSKRLELPQRVACCGGA
eukprot:366297-Chlamydomonas_euryale.AAC.2